MDLSEQFRAGLVQAGLEGHADALLAAALPSVRLRAVGPGPPAVAYRSTPVQVLGPEAGVVAIAGSDHHTLALRDDGSVLAWGNNETGTLGDGTRTDRASPAPIPGLSDVVAVTASLALRADGSVLVWGDHPGDRHNGWTVTKRRRPVPVEGLDGPVYAITGSRATLEDGTVVMVDTGRPVPVPARSADDPPPIADDAAPTVATVAGYSHNLGLTDAGDVLAWEDRRYGSADDPDVIRRRTPSPVPGLDDGTVAAVAAGFSHSFALNVDGTALAWGSNFFGQLGDGTTTNRSSPVPVTGLPPAQAIVPGAALTRDGAVYAWGGQLPIDTAELDAALPIGASKLGGCPDLPAGTPWPSRDERPMAFVAQIDLADIATLADGELPPDGLLSFFSLFIDWGFGGSDSGSVIHTPAPATLTRIALPAGLPAGERLPPARLEAERELTGVHWESPQLERLGLSWEQRNAYGEATGQEDCAQHRMLGHPQIVQNDPREDDDDLCLLLQLDSDSPRGMEFGDLGRLYYWLDRPSLKAGHLDRCVFDFQQT